MSEDNNGKKPDSEALKRFQADIEKFKEEDQKEAQKREEERQKVEEFKKKKLLVDDYKITNELKRIQKNEEDLQVTGKINVGKMTEDLIKETQEQARSYTKEAKHGMLFLHEKFRRFVPMWSGNIILIGGKSGRGKTSTAINLVFSTIQQKHPASLLNRKVLYISSEETRIQVFNRLSCLYRGYNYNDFEDFTEEQHEELIKLIPRWANNGVSVIGDDGFGATNTLEGVESILKNLVSTKEHYDLILFDYIQKITVSKKNPNMRPDEVMREVMSLIDSFKNVYPGVIVVLSQLKVDDNDSPIEFQQRIPGCKDIVNPCTTILELIPDTKLLMSRFIVIKSRYKGHLVGQHVDMGFDRGRFVDYSDEFKKQVAGRNEEKGYTEVMGRPVTENKEEKKE